MPDRRSKERDHFRYADRGAAARRDEAARHRLRHVVRGGRARVNKAAVAPSKVSGHTILAFDFGARWIGVAVGDTETRLANPLGMFDAASGRRRMQEVAALVRGRRPEELVVGPPLALYGRALDIAFSRDAFDPAGLHHQVKASQIPSAVGGRHIGGVYAWLYAGRTVRAAMNEVFD